MRLPSIRALLIVPLLAGGAGAGAATLTVRVADQGSAPLVDAVVYATPVVPPPVPKPPAPAEIGQANLAFDPTVTVVQTGGSVSFPNRDTVRHQVYSFSAAKVFELRLYAGRPATPLVFDKPGVVVLGCNIHDRMLAYVLVVDTPWFAKTVAGGQAKIDGLPPGEYRLSIWTPKMASAGPAKTIVVAGDASVDAVVDVKAVP